MSSLMQHSGRIENGQVELRFYLVEKSPRWDYYNGPSAYKPSPDSTTFCDPTEYIEFDGRRYIQLYRAWRKPIGMFGCWVVFRYNGAKHVPDLSLPIAALKLPRDCKPLTADECAAVWNS